MAIAQEVQAFRAKLVKTGVATHAEIEKLSREKKMDLLVASGRWHDRQEWRRMFYAGQ